MPGKIKILSDHVANQIAAGEVVERPASVLKELIENSLDAGASVLEIEINGAGEELIRVVDDGEGMSRDDALLCLERHATSKLHTAENIENITTYGFRGEAIPSIASISEFRIRTCRRGENSGTEVFVRYGKLVNVKDCGCPFGTTVEVRRLFANTPARKKFLKTPLTEMAHLERTLHVTALVHPEISIHYKSNNKIRNDWPACSSQRRIVDILGRDIYENLIFVDQKTDEQWHLLGWISRLDYWHTSREHIYWFVNKRHATNRALEHAIRETYRCSGNPGKYPVVILNLSVPTHEVDVNVHPSKREVKFRHEQRLGAWLADAMSKALSKTSPTHTHHFPTQHTPNSAQKAAPKTLNPDNKHQPALEPESQVNKTQIRHIVGWTGISPVFQAHKPPPASQKTVEGNNPAKANSANKEQLKFNKTHRDILQISLIGRVRERYWVGETSEGMVMFDQLAAQQRILFEKLLKEQLSGSIPGQGLLEPERITLTAQQAERLKEYIPALRKAGLIIEEFGGHDFIIEALPPFWERGDNTRRILDLIGDLEHERTSAQVRRLISEQLVAKVLARHLAGQPRMISEKEAQKLLDDLLACDLPYTNPDGRPTIVLFTDRDIARRFGRE